MILAGDTFTLSFVPSLNFTELWLPWTGLFSAYFLIFGISLFFFKWLIIRRGKQFGIIVRSIWQSLKDALGNNEYIVIWTQKNPRTISFIKARLDTSAFSGLTLSVLMLAFIYVVALFAGVVEDLITSDSIVAIDAHIANLVFTLRTDLLTTIFSWITLLGKSHIIIGFIGIALVLLWIWKKSYYIFPFLISVVGSVTFTYLGKLAMHRPRPELAIYAEHSFSFPSGHATIAVAFYGFAGYLLMHATQNWNRKVNILFSILFIIIAIGFSRIYLGVHYISDVWSGYLVGAMWLIIAISFSEWRRHQQKSAPRRPPVTGVKLISYALVSIAIVFYILYSINYHPPLATMPSKVARNK